MNAKKILIAEDEVVSQALLKKALSVAGWEVVVTGDGKACLEAYHKQRFDMVFLDIMMPHISGLKVLEEIRRDATGRYVPIIMITAKSEKDVLLEAAKAGADDFIVKPVSFSSAGDLNSRFGPYLINLTLTDLRQIVPMLRFEDETVLKLAVFQPFHRAKTAPFTLTYNGTKLYVMAPRALKPQALAKLSDQDLGKALSIFTKGALRHYQVWPREAVKAEAKPRPKDDDNELVLELDNLLDALG